MIKGEIDRPQLERSLKKFAKAFGDSNAQAVTRWAVSACRELAFESQVWGAKQTRKKQEATIISDAYNVLLVVEKLEKSRNGSGFRATNQGRSYGVSPENALVDESSVNSWIEENRTRRRKRTAKLPREERKVCDKNTFNKAIRQRFAKSGMVKGGWIGAGHDIARAQTGSERVTIGRSFLSYAQKHSGIGKSKRPTSGWRPVASITNMTNYSGDHEILSKTGERKAFDWSLKKTVKWYQKAVKALDNKKTT